MDLALRSINVQEISSRPLSSEAQKERRLAKYNGQIVLLDPKNYGENPEGTDGDKIYARVKDLAQELSKMMPEECQTLHCKGWYEDSKRKQFYLVYEPPPYSSAPTEYKTLYDYIGSTFRPSLNDRISLARQLAKSIHQIHEKGWLHKGIRSDHVLFFPEKRGAPRSINNPRLVGFDFARRDAADEVSEKNVKISTHANLYRHPEALSKPSPAFTKLHDYYSLGILLAEIAMWKNIRDILEQHPALQLKESKESDIRKVRDILLDHNSDENHPREISFLVGNIYRDVVKICLRGDFEDKSDRGLLEAFEREVVNKLARHLV